MRNNGLPDEDEATDRQTEVEALEAAAADAEARAKTARAELVSVRRQLAETEVELGQASSDRDVAREERERLLSELEEVRTAAREAVVRYRSARLAAAPEVPGEMVSESEDIEVIDRDFEAAQKLVGDLRQRLEEEALERARAFRLPASGQARHPADSSSLSAAEKIRLGLEQAMGREGR